MLYLIFAIPLLSFLCMMAFVLDEWEEEKRKKKEEAEREKRYEKIFRNILTKP